MFTKFPLVIKLSIPGVLPPTRFHTLFEFALINALFFEKSIQLISCKQFLALYLSTFSNAYSLINSF